MDTNTYGNIMKALGGSQGATTGNDNSRLTLEQQSQNYNTFSELMKQGISLPDLLKKIESMEAKLKSIEDAPRSDLNRELFEVMEASVKGDPAVKEAKQKVSDVKSTIITEMCMKDPRYEEAYNEYRTAVNKSYVQSKEKQASDRGDCPPVCIDPEGSVPHQEGDEDDEIGRGRV